MLTVSAVAMYTQFWVVLDVAGCRSEPNVIFVNLLFLMLTGKRDSDIL